MTGVALTSRLKLAALLTVTGVIITSHAPSEPSTAHAPGKITEITGLVLSRPVISKVAARVSYWSTGPNGVPMLSSAALFVPTGTPPPGGWPIVARAHGTTGLGDECAPSRTGLDEFQLPPKVLGRATDVC